MEEDQLIFFNINFTQLLKIALVFSAAFYLIIYLWVAYFRLQYPFDLEWIEGGMVDQVQRIVNGEGIYIAPSINFVPFIYPPLYFYLSAVASILLGGGLFPLRLVSFIASLVSFILIYLIVRDETKNSLAAFLSAGLFPAAFRVTGAWLDIARVDSLFVTLWLLFIYFARGKKTLAYSMLTGALVAMAFLTKQTALMTCLPVIVYLFWQNWKYALSLLIVATVIIGMVTLFMERASSGWYTYYVFSLLTQQTEWEPWRFVSFWTDDLMVHVPIAILFTIFFLSMPKKARPILIKWLSVLAGALAGSFITRVKLGGYDNVLLPAYAAISILFGLGLSESLKLANQLFISYRSRIVLLIYISCLIQLLILFYNPIEQIPTKADLDEGYKLVKFLSTVSGEVYIPDHGYLATLAGKKVYAHHSAIWDVVRGNKQSTGKGLLTEDLDAAIRQQLFDVIILDSEWNYCCSEISQYYSIETYRYPDESAFYTITGWKRRPTYIFYAKRLKEQ